MRLLAKKEYYNLNMQEVILILTFLSFIGGAGVASLIETALSSFSSEEDRNQHQKDITVEEIRKLKSKLQDINTNLIKNINNKNKVKIYKLEIIAYLASWSVNLVYNRVNKKMIIYSLKPLLILEYSITAKQLKYHHYGKHYQRIVLEAKKLFKICDIIK